MTISLAGKKGVKGCGSMGKPGWERNGPVLLPLVNEGARDVALAKQPGGALVQVQVGGDGAASNLPKKNTLPADLKLTASAALNAVRWENLKAEAAKLLPLPQGREAQPLPPVSELVKLKGDPIKGAAVFRSENVACHKCHQVNGEGIDFGPNLSEIGTKLGKDALYESILNPSAGISFGFEGWLLTLKNEDEAYGLIVSETADELALKTAAGVVTRYKKSDLASRAKQKLSIMPEGLQQGMVRQELVDLVEYLASLKKAGP